MPRRLAVVYVSLLLAGGCDLVFPPAGRCDGVDGHDEDGDGQIDDCDPCPANAAAADDLDTDGDGLGDGCDPDPAVTGDSRIAFYGFGPGTACTDPGITWCTDGAFANDDVLFSDGEILFAGVHDNVTVTIGLELGTMPTPGLSFNEVGMILAGSSSMFAEAQGIYAIVGWDDSAAESYVQLFQQRDTDDTLLIDDVPVGLDALGISATMTCAISGANVKCALTTSVRSFSFSSPLVELPPGQVGLFGYNIDSTVHYADVIANHTTQ